MAASVLNLASLLSPATLLPKNSATAQAKASDASNATTGTTTTSSGGLTGTSVGTTFLNLLVKELQNQDPTAPMDSTAMVGQMISLNQLDQLISINQVLSTATSSTASGTSGATSGVAGVASPATSSSAQVAQRTALLTSLQNISASQAATGADQTLDLSNFNIPNGGK